MGLFNLFSLFLIIKGFMKILRTLSIFAIIGVIICFSSCGSNGSFKQFAYYKQESPSYRIFVYITNATPQQMEKHAQKQMWSKMGTTMVCYFNSSEGLNSDAITLAPNVDAAIDQVWKPTMVARYMHWPTGKETFEEHPYSE